MVNSIAYNLHNYFTFKEKNECSSDEIAIVYLILSNSVLYKYMCASYDISFKSLVYAIVRL